jgi:uncharacterized protein
MDHPTQSPCIRNCCLDDDLVCLGCFRTLEEIKQWGSADAAQREQILEAAEQRKALKEKSRNAWP